MPRYFFHIRDHEELSVDEEGSGHDDLDGALEEAQASARDLGKQYIDQRQAIDDQIVEICDESGALIAALRVSEVLKHGRWAGLH